MTAAILTFPTQRAVDEAWEALHDLHSEVVDDPRILLNRDFYQRLTEAEARFKALYLARYGK